MMPRVMIITTAAAAAATVVAVVAAAATHTTDATTTIIAIALNQTTNEAYNDLNRLLNAVLCMCIPYLLSIDVSHRILCINK